MTKKKKSAVKGKSPKSVAKDLKPKRRRRRDSLKEQAQARNLKRRRELNPGKMGAPTAFDEDMANQIFALATTGMSEKSIAAAVRVSESTFTIWKHKYPDFFACLKEAKNNACEMVEGALFRRATGYSHPALKIHFDAFGNVTTEKYVEHYPPSESAAIFFLKNRKSKDWKDTSGRELSGPNGQPLAGPQVIVTLPSNGREAPVETSKPEAGEKEV